MILILSKFSIVVFLDNQTTCGQSSESSSDIQSNSKTLEYAETIPEVKNMISNEMDIEFDKCDNHLCESDNPQSESNIDKILELNNNSCTKICNNNNIQTSFNESKSTDYVIENCINDSCALQIKKINANQSEARDNQNILKDETPCNNEPYNIHQLLQQHVINTNQLQHLMKSQPYQSQMHSTVQYEVSQSHSSSGHQQRMLLDNVTQKQLEQNIVQLQEQLQLNLLQQTHLLQQMNSERRKNFLQIQHQLAVQQQDIMHKLQIIQRQYLMFQGGNNALPINMSGQYHHVQSN